MFSENNDTVYFNKLDDLLKEYNETKHRSIGMSPREASRRKMKSASSRISMGNFFFPNLGSRSFLWVIGLESQNTNTNGRFSTRDINLTGQKKSSSLIRSCIRFLRLINSSIFKKKKSKDYSTSKNFNVQVKKLSESKKLFSATKRKHL